MTWTQTYTGHQFDIFNPDPEAIHIADIAHSLALTNRFGGHTVRPYSVAQHSVLVSKMVPEQYALHGLLHDAAEAYIGDLPAPWKLLVQMAGQGIDEIEAKIDEAIRLRFGLLGEAPVEVWQQDRLACAAERLALMPSGHDWGELDEIAEANRDILPKIERMTWQWAEQEFLQRFKELTA
jgi:uncharacterized protein